VENYEVIKEIPIPINDDLRRLGVHSIVVGHSDMTDNYYLVIDIVIDVRFNIDIKNDYYLPGKTSRILSHKISCPIHKVLDVTGYVEDNPVLFKNAIRKLRDGKNGI
jgi:hypothetical protein